MRIILWLFWIPLAAIAGGLAGSIPVFTMGLVVPVFIVGPLSLVTGSLLAALCAGWVANLADAGGSSARTKTRLWAIFCVSLCASIVGLLTGFLAAGMVNALKVGPNFVTDLAVYLPGAVIFLVAIVFATWRLRTPVDTRLGTWGAVALILSGAWVLFLVLVEGLGYSLGLVPSDFATGPFVQIATLGGSLIMAALGMLLLWRSSRVRSGESSLRSDAALSLTLIAIMPLLVAGAVYLGCSASSCGA